MTLQNEHRPEAKPGWRGGVIALAFVGMVGLAPSGASAEVTDDDDASQTTLQEAQAQLDAARAQLDEAQAKLDEASKSVPQGMGEPTSKDQPAAPVDAVDPAGPGFVSKDGATKKLQWALNKDGSRYFRIALWLQVWTRAMQLNPGTTILDDPTTPELEGDQPSWIGDVGLRRARVLMFGEIFPRVFLLMHFGINNQTFRRDAGSGFKQSLFFHDAWTEFAAIKEHLYIGGGLLYWNGISRMTNASTITLMSLDAPISNWPTIEQTDQFARQLGLYAKGKAGLFDYRVSATRPFVPTVGVSTTGNFNPTANTWAFAGYFQLQFWDIESDVLPYTVGTYIGKKRVMNLGTGFYVQPRGIAYLDGAGNLRERSNSIASADFFVDLPLKGENAGAITAYGAYYWWDFGPNNLRNIGIMNVGDPTSGTSLAGRGNNYPMLGTGNSGYGQFGWLMPWKVNAIQFQPYVLSQMSKFDALNDTMFQFGVGVNMFLSGHNAKVTLEYRNRPIFNTDGNVESRKGNALVLQMHLFI